MASRQNRRKFLKYGFIGAAGFLAALTPVRLDMAEGFKLSEGGITGLGMSKAHAACGASLSCAGGGGECGASLNCAGGGGQCGASLNCAGGGGQCGAGMDCAGS